MFRSLPALKQALSRMEDIAPTQSAAAVFEAADLVRAYRVPACEEVEGEARALAKAVALLAERTIRLESAYEYWQPFEPGPYFDLRALHAELMCQVEERNGLVHVRVYADLLSPSFRAAERFCVDEFLPIVRASRTAKLPRRVKWARELQQRMWPALQERLTRAEQVIEQAIAHLTQAGNVSFIVAWGAVEERRRVGPQSHEHLSTLTLDFSFPLPLKRRPHRRDILRRRLQRRRAAGRPLLRRSGPDRLWRVSLRRSSDADSGE